MKELPMDEALTNISFFEGPQPDLQQLKLEKLRTKLSKIELILRLMCRVKTKLLSHGFLRCLQTL